MPLLIQAALTFIDRMGTEEQLKPMPGPVMIWNQAPFSILVSTPKTMIPGMQNDFCVDIWIDNKKHFSARWTTLDLKDCELISLKRGPWIPVLLDMADRCMAVA